MNNKNIRLKDIFKYYLNSRENNLVIYKPHNLLVYFYICVEQ